MDNPQNRRLDDKLDEIRQPGQLGWSESGAAAAPAAMLTDDDIAVIWQTMPGGRGGWLKSFGFLQFARAVEEQVLENNVFPASPASADNPSTPEFSERDIPADAPRAFARRYTALLEENRKLKAAATDNPSTAGAAIPIVLFDGMAVYDEITRKLGKSHCHSPSTVSETLDAVVRILRHAAPVGQSTAGAEKGGITSEAFEKIAESWDGCEYDCIDIGSALRADFERLAAPAAKAPDQVRMSQRESFEHWYSDEGKSPRAVERSGEGYKLMGAQSAWNAWKACYKALDITGRPSGPPLHDAVLALNPSEVLDQALLDSMDALIEQNKQNGHHHFVFAFDTDSSARKQIANDEILQSALRTASKEGN